MTTKTETKLVREGDLLAEVDITVDTLEHEWSPLIPPEAIEKLERVRDALRRGDISLAAVDARIYKLTPIETEVASGMDAQ